MKTEEVKQWIEAKICDLERELKWLKASILTIDMLELNQYDNSQETSFSSKSPRLLREQSPDSLRGCGKVTHCSDVNCLHKCGDGIWLCDDCSCSTLSAPPETKSEP